MFNTSMKVSFWLYCYCDSIFVSLETFICGGVREGASWEVTNLAGSGNTPSSLRTCGDMGSSRVWEFSPTIALYCAKCFCKPLEELESNTGYLACLLLQGQHYYLSQTLSCPGDCCFQPLTSPLPFPYEMVFPQCLCRTNEYHRLIKGT